MTSVIKDLPQVRNVDLGFVYLGLNLKSRYKSLDCKKFCLSFSKKSFFFNNKFVVVVCLKDPAHDPIMKFCNLHPQAALL